MHAMQVEGASDPYGNGPLSVPVVSRAYNPADYLSADQLAALQAEERSLKNRQMAGPKDGAASANPQGRDRQLSRQYSWVVPEPDQQHKPYFFSLMIALNVAGFIYSMYKADWEFEPTSINPMFGPSAALLDDLGAKNTQKIINGEIWRLVTPMFLHGGVIHLAMNMAVLFRVGFDLERAFGFARVAPIYFLSGLSGSLLSAVFVPKILGVGASGAIYGIIGALFGDLLQNYKKMGDGLGCYLFSLVFSTVLGLGIGLLPFLDNFAHLGGYIVGFFAGAIFLHNETFVRELHPWYSRLLVYTSTFVLVVYFIVGISVLFANVDANDWCPNCKYMTCVEIAWSCDQEQLCSCQLGDETWTAPLNKGQDCKTACENSQP